MPAYRVRLTRKAEEDLARLHAFLLERDADAANHALDAIDHAWRMLERFPFSCRKAAGGALGPSLRELVIPFGSAGYVALFEIEDAETVTVLALRHQREEDYH